MEYPILSKLYYKDREKYNGECLARKESVSATVLPLFIHGQQAFYMNCPQMTSLLCEIYKQLQQLKKESRELPGVAYGRYARNCLIDEVLLTNDLEGVYSTKKEISEILDASGKDAEKKARLRGMVLKYEKLLRSDKGDVDLHSCEGIRALYDEIVLAEIPENRWPDGKIFRKDQVSVVTVTERERHRGVAPPEKNVVEHMSAALQLLDDGDIPPLIGIALLHYFIGYIHPFYDGNGRLSRFISSYLIKRELDTLVALRLSYAIKNNTRRYYTAFDLANDRKNCGDTTPFILSFLEIILDAEKSLREKFQQGFERYSYYTRLIQPLEAKWSNDEMSVLFVMIQNELFGSEPFDVQGLADAMGMSQSKLRLLLKNLMRSEVADAVKTERKGHRLTYGVDLESLEAICEEMHVHGSQEAAQ